VRTCCRSGNSLGSFLNKYKEHSAFCVILKRDHLTPDHLLRYGTYIHVHRNACIPCISFCSFVCVRHMRVLCMYCSMTAKYIDSHSSDNTIIVSANLSKFFVWFLNAVAFHSPAIIYPDIDCCFIFCVCVKPVHI
jgi:hypothetical protein